ncbi:MAG TPA: beta-lactamase family protein [Hydrogenispora sp.]|nr:beta-lactamase family protein [Hydrogenispora sp.]
MTIDEAKAFFYVFLLLLFLILNLWHKASAASRNEIQEYIEEFQKKSGVKKVSVVVYEKGKIDYYGNTDTKSLYQIGSLTKSFTGLGILKLVKDGGISLTDDISELLDGFQAYFQGKRAQITVEDLLRHRSGFTNSERDYPSANPEMSLMEWVDSLSGKDLKFEPGIGYSYANTNYNLLGAIIFDLIFSGITILGIVLLIIAAFYFKKRKVLFFCVVTMLSLFIGQMLIIPLIFQSGWKKIALVWAPWSVLGGLMTQFIDIIVLSIMAIVRGKDADNSEKGGQPTTDRDCGISGLG